MFSKLYDSFLNVLISFAHKRPYYNLDGYMERDWVIKPNRWLPFAARLHHILRSDDDRALHDHPWSYVTIILRGGYWEITDKHGVEVMTWHAPGSILFRRATHKHRLVVPKGKTVLTMFFMGRKRQDWGFFTAKGKIPWQVYTNSENYLENQ